MTADPPYAFVIDRDSEARKATLRLLGEAGFVVAGFAETRGALAAVAARPAALAVIAGYLPDGGDGFAAARQARLYQRDLKVLFTAASGAAAVAPESLNGHVVTRPFDKRRFLGAVFELLARDDGDDHQRAAELGIVEAELSCLVSRRDAAKRGGAGRLADELTRRIGDATTAREALLLSPDPGRGGI